MEINECATVEVYGKGKENEQDAGVTRMMETRREGGCFQVGCRVAGDTDVEKSNLNLEGGVCSRGESGYRRTPVKPGIKYRI